MSRRAMSWGFLLAGFLLIACEQPEQLVMEENQLAYILADLHVAEAALQNVYASKKDSLAKIYYEQVFQIHRIERAELDSAMAVLHRNPDIQQEVYTRVMEILSEYEVKFEH